MALGLWLSHHRGECYIDYGFNVENLYTFLTKGKELYSRTGELEGSVIANSGGKRPTLVRSIGDTPVQKRGRYCQIINIMIYILNTN